MTEVFPSQEKSLVQWRERVKHANKNKLIEKRAVDELCAAARTLVHFYFRSPGVQSESAIRRELAQLAKALERASEALKALGSAGIIHIQASAGVMGDDSAVEEFLQSGKMLVLSRWARAASDTSRVGYSRKAMPGPLSDRRLKSVVWLLADLYQQYLGVRPTNSTSPSTGKTTSMFNEFLRAAFSDFAPPDSSLSLRQLDSAARAAIKELKSPP